MQSLTFLYDRAKADERRREALAWLADRMRWEQMLAGLRDEDHSKTAQAA